MEASDVDKCGAGVEDAPTLNRCRSLKSKQLVRSQAIRESQSPPRAATPVDDASPVDRHAGMDNAPDDVRQHCGSNDATPGQLVVNNGHAAGRDADADADVGGACKVDQVEEVDEPEGAEVEDVKQPVEIQITSGGWEISSVIDQRQRARRWLGHDLLTHQPRVACVCGRCRAQPRPPVCQECRGGRRRRPCPAKQDSGIVCSDECPDCTTDLDNNDISSPRQRKAESLDVEQSESSNFCRCQDKIKNVSLGRTDYDQTEPTGVDLINFIKDTLNKNSKDRMTLLRIERELHALVSDTSRVLVRFPVMTSYGRMLVHRCASLFQLSHHLDQHNKSSVLVSKSGTSGGRIPCTNFRAWCVANFPASPTHAHDMQAKSILKRDAHSLDEPHGGGAGQGGVARSKSLEQREREYERVRRRIFSTDNCSQDEVQWPWLTSGQVKLLTPDSGKNKLLKVQSLETSSPSQPPRGAVAKSHSFGGYEPPPPRLLSRQGDLASSSWRLSPSSSGYKTLSLRSTDSVTPSPTGGVSPEPLGAAGGAVERSLVWAVTDLAAVPVGALIIHPQTGCPLTNADGSVYHYDPSHPPIFHNALQLVNDQSLEKRRGRLEKQHSFMENEYDCQSEDYRSKQCCCECKHADWSEDITSEDCQACTSVDKEQTQSTEAIVDHQTQAQCSSQYEASACDATANKSAAPDEPANHEMLQQNGACYIENNYTEDYRNEEQCPQCPQQNLMQQGANLVYSEDIPTSQAKGPMVPYQDGIIRQVSLGGQVYPAVAPTIFTYPTHCRIDQQDHVQPALPLYLPEPPKEPTFRIDRSYPYAAVALEAAPPAPAAAAPAPHYLHVGGCAGGCGVDPATALPACVAHAHRSYALPYGQALDATQMLHHPYPLANVVLPQQQLHQYTQYPPPLQWPLPAPPAAAPAPVPAAEHALYPHYPLVTYPYPPGCQLLQYPLCPVYPPQQTHPSHPPTDRRAGVDSAQRFHSKRNSMSGSSRTTPLESGTQQAVDGKHVPYDKYNNSDGRAKQGGYNDHNSAYNGGDYRRRSYNRSYSARGGGEVRPPSGEIAATIQQIKQQMAQMSTGERGARARNRNPNPGILGSGPAAPHAHAPHAPPPQHPTQRQDGQINDESHLNSQARAIVDSLRHLQAKSTNPPNETRRPDSNGAHYQHRPGHHRGGRRPEGERELRRDDAQAQGNNTHHNTDAGWVPGQYRGRPAGPMPSYQCRPPYFMRQMPPGIYRRSPPVHVPTAMNHPRRPPPDNRNGRR